MFFFSSFPRFKRVICHNTVPPDSSSGFVFKCISRHDLHGKEMAVFQLAYFFLNERYGIPCELDAFGGRDVYSWVILLTG